MPDPLYEARKEVARANRAFYAAFEALDLAAMRAAWLDDDRIQCVHPGGEILLGRQKVFRTWQAMFEHTESIRFELSDVQVQVAGDSAWVTLVERIRSTAGGQQDESVTVATNVLTRTPGGWRLVLHHASPLQRRFFPEGT
jgi:ketosteroid isomerase-like protein